MSSRSSFTTIVSASENWISRLGIDGAGEQGLLSSSSQMKHLLRMMSAGRVLFITDGLAWVVAMVGERRGWGKGIMAETVHLICRQLSHDPWSSMWAMIMATVKTGPPLLD